MSLAPIYNQMLSVLTGPGTPFTVGDATVNGREHKVYENGPPQVRLLWLFSEAPAEQAYLVFEDERMTWGEARERVLEIANGLINDHGVQPGESVGIAMRNYPEWVLAWWAIQMAGAVAVEHNSFWNGEELTYGVTDSGSRVMIVDQERHDVLLPHAEGIRAGGLDLEFIVARASGDLSERAVHWADVNGGTDVPDLPEEVCGHESRSAMVYTSGTTAFPKGVVHTQRNVVTNLLNMLSMTIALGMTETAAAGGDPAAAAAGDDDSGGPVMLVAVPLFHVTGSHCVMMPITAAKGTLVLMRKWDAGLALELIEREKITNFTGVPTMTMDILAHPDFESTDTTTLVSLGSGGAPNPPHMVEKVTSTTENASPTQGYGLSEVSGIATANGGKMYLSKPGSCGLKAPVTEMKVIDEDGNALPAGERGELCIYGPNVFAEYHNKPEATAEAIDPEGWFHTGDVAIIDEEGYVFIVDRAKDVVIRGGENIGSAEVEAAIAQHPLVHECAVFGVPNERLGEEVGVAIYPLAGETVDPKDIQTFAGERLASFKVPAHVFMYDEPLPKNANGKILKRQLRDDAAS